MAIGNTSMAQTADDIRQMADSAVKAFTWDVVEGEMGNMMFLDVAFQRDNADSIEFLTLSVAKSKKEPRPDFISVIVPGNVDENNGIFLKFASSVAANNDGNHFKLEDGPATKIHFEKCDGKTCTARMVNGIALSAETNNKIDIFQKCQQFDHLLFLFFYPDGSHKSVAVPLFSFKEQYNRLP